MATKKKSVPLPDTGIDWENPVGEFTPLNPTPAEPAATEQPSSKLRRAADYIPTLVKSAIGVPEAAVGMADLVTGGRVGKFLENEGGAIGFRPKEARAALDEFYSPEQKAAFQEVQNADGFIGTGMAALRNPSVIGQSVVESLGLMGAGGVIARGAGALAPRVSATMRGALGEGAVGAGSAAEQIRQETADGLLTGKQAALGAASGLADTVFGALGGKIAQRLGIADVDTMLAGKGNPVTTKGFVRSVLEGAASEGLLEELPQSIAEQVLQNAALDKPLSEGVDQAAVLGLLTGGFMGGGANAVNSLFPAEHPADEIRATKQPETGPLTKGLNAAIETHADAVESAVADAVTQTRRQQTAPIVGQLRALPPEQQDEALQMMAVADNMRAPGPVRRRAQNRLDFLLGSVAPPVDAGVDPAAGEIAAPALPADEVPAPEIAETGRDQRPVSEAPPVDDPTAAIAQREADRPAPTITPRQDDDILTASGNPFLNMTSAMRALGRAGEGFELARVDGGLVVRRAAPAPNDAEVTTPITEASPAPALTTRPQPTTTGAAVIDARPSGTRGTSASDVLPANSATAAQPVSPQAPVGQPVEGAGNPQPTLAAPSATQATDLEDRLINVRDGARRWFSSDAEDGGRDYAGEYQALDDNGTPEFAAAAERILSDYKAARAKSFQPTREVDAASRQAAVERAGQPDTRTPPEVAFDQSPELAIQALTAAQQDAMGKELRVSRAKRTSVGFIEALAGKARAEVRSAYLKAAAPNDPNQSSRATPEAAEAPRSEAPAPARIDAAAPASVPAAGGTATVEAGGVAAPAAPAPSKKRSVPAAKAAAARDAKLADYFAPGNVVKAYGGHDRVLSFHPATESEPRWAAVVHSVIKKDGQWVDDPNDNRERQHATEPSEKELKAGPVARAPVKEPAPEILASKTEQDRPALGETTASVSVRPGGGEQLTDPFSNDFAALEGKTVEQHVTVAETGQTATLRMDAAKAMRDIESRQQALEQLKKCIGKSK